MQLSQACQTSGSVHVLEAGSKTTYASLREGFAWRLPDRLNIGTACSDGQDAASLALVELRDGEVREHTFGALVEASNRLANGLAGLGVARGDRVGILLAQGFETAIAHLAVYKLGAVAVPLTQLFGPDALGFRLGDSAARVVITDTDQLDVVGEVVADLDEVSVVVAGDDASDPHHALDDLLRDGSARLEPAGTTPDDPALLIYTSGTTGPPKGALHGHRVLYGHLPGFELAYEFFPQPGDRMWTPADWAWIGGLFDAVMPAWFHGRPVVATPRGKFDPEWALDVLRDQRVTAAFLPPTALKLLRQARPDSTGLSLRAVMTGGEPLGAEMLAWGRDELGIALNEIYGQTEANLLVGNCSSVWEVRPGSMGRPLPGHDVAVLGSDGDLAAVDEQGEIVARAPDPVMFLEYWNRPDATEDKYTVLEGAQGTERWLRTGDVGRRDSDGYLWFVARDDDVIISAGYRIGPGEIEDTLATHPAVTLAAAVGVPDEVRGEVVKAFVQLADGHAPSDELHSELQDLVRTRLAAYEYPRDIEFVDELPLTTTGKIRRIDLRQREQQRRDQ